MFHWGRMLGSGASHAVVGPAGGSPGGGVEAVAAVDDDAPGGEGAGVVGGEVFAVFVPFGDDHDCFRVADGVVAVGGVVELRVDAAGVVDRFGVGDDDVGAEAFESDGDIEGGGVADVVGVGFEG